jgi:alpha-mannosidase
MHDTSAHTLAHALRARRERLLPALPAARPTAAGHRRRGRPARRDRPASGIVVEIVKLAEDGSGDVIVRVYEALAGRATARLELGFAADRAHRVDLLEHDLDEQPADALQLELRAFEVATVRVQRA